jgi:hypothetical protein
MDKMKITLDWATVLNIVTLLEDEREKREDDYQAVLRTKNPYKEEYEEKAYYAKKLHEEFVVAIENGEAIEPPIPYFLLQFNKSKEGE